MEQNSNYRVLSNVCVSCGVRIPDIDFEIKPAMRETYGLFLVTAGKGISGATGRLFEKLVRLIITAISNPVSSTHLYSNIIFGYAFTLMLEYGKSITELPLFTGYSMPSIIKIPVESLFQYFDVCDDNSDTVYAACRTNGKVLILLSYYIQYYPSRKSTETDYIMQARDYIERNFRDVSCTVKSVADKVQIDRTYLYRLFKEETGFSVIEYINNCRIGRACTMLNNTNVQIKDVALSVGFSDQLYFSKVFRKLKGITPTEYRKKYANETTL